MPILRCPQCDGAISSVASRCPGCGVILVEERPVLGGSGEIACHRCHAWIRPDATVCCNCGTIGPKNLARVRAKQMIAASIVGIVVVTGAWSKLRQSVTPYTASAESPGVVTTADPLIAAPATTAPVRPAPSPSTVTRWTNTWVNIREGRGMDTPVVQVLDPGQTIAVANRDGSWWEAYVNGRPIGYVSNSALELEPPSL